MRRETVGERTRGLRRQHDLTLRGLADAADISPGHLSRIENGIMRPSAETMAAIAAVFGLSGVELSGAKRGRPCFFCGRNWDGPALYVTVTNSEHKLTALSPAFAAKLGYQPDEMLENHSYIFVAERDQPAMARRRRELARKGTHIDRIALVAKDGSEQDWQYRMRPLITAGAGVQFVIAWQPKPRRRKRPALALLVTLIAALLTAAEVIDMAMPGNDLGLERLFG